MSAWKSRAISSTRKSTASPSTTRSARESPVSGPARRRRGSSSSVSRTRFSATSRTSSCRPRVDNALRERGVEAVDTPDVRDVSIEEGQPLTFTASFETVPTFEPGDYSTLTLRQPSATVEEAAVDEALERLRDRAARFEPVEGRGLIHGDTAVVDLERREDAMAKSTDTQKRCPWSLARARTRRDSTSSCSASSPARRRRSPFSIPADYAIAELAGAERRLHRDGQGDQEARRCRNSTTSSPRTWATSRRWRRCARASGQTWSTRRGMRPNTRCGRT